MKFGELQKKQDRRSVPAKFPPKKLTINLEILFSQVLENFKERSFSGFIVPKGFAGCPVVF